MSTSPLKPVTVERNGQFWQLRDPAHVAAFLADGWKIVPETAVAEQPKKAKKRE